MRMLVPVLVGVLVACGAAPKTSDRPGTTDSALGTTPTGTPGGTPGGTTPTSTPTGVTPTPTADTGVPTPPNVLLIVLDDVGVDFLPMYGATGSPVPETPTLDDLAAEGVRFTAAWSAPLCSPTRAELLTGRYARHFGLGTAVRYGDAVDLPADAQTLPELLGPTWTSAFVGKWHLTAGDAGLTAPTDQGFGWWAGTLGNIDEANSPTGDRGQTYDRWEKVTDGELAHHEVYATTDTVDDAIARLPELEEPWFLEVAFNAAHSPYHYPDPKLTHRDWRDAPATAAHRFGAMIEAIDHEVARLIAAAAPARDRTLIVIAGDNGTPPGIIPKPAKGSVYEPGVHVPLVMAGPRVVPGVVDAPVHLVDVSATVLDLAGVSADIDGVSLAPCLQDAACRPRETAFTQMFTPNGPGPYTAMSAAVRDQRYKLVEGFQAEHRPEPLLELYDLKGAGEAVDLLAGEPAPDVLAIRDRLLAELDRYLER